MKRPSLAAALGAVLLCPTSAWALQPLADFQTAAKGKNLDVREAEAVGKQRDEELSASTFKLAPVLIGTAGYTRNQYEVKTTIPGRGTATITPKDQLDATIRAELPLIDVGAWQRRSAASAARDAQAARVGQVQNDTAKEVARLYHQVLALEAMSRAAGRSLKAAEENAKVIGERQTAGLATDLDKKRAASEVEIRKQTVAETDNQLVIARRNLRTATGLAPSDGGELPEDDLHDEAPLAGWEDKARDVPSVRVATLDAVAAGKTADATAAGLYPSVLAFGQDRFTNATGFGKSPVWALGLQATIRLDLSTWSTAKAAGAAHEVAKVREERAQTLARDQIFAAWQTVKAQIAKSRAARAQADAAHEAARLAKERLGAGTATTLDLLLAERDALSADASRIQADADLAYARVALRLVAGESR